MGIPAVRTSGVQVQHQTITKGYPMTELPRHFATPEDAYYGFFKADAAQDAEAWAAVMSYPHVRVAAQGRGEAYFETPEQFARSGHDWTERVKTGWVLTRGRAPVRWHETDNRVLLVGGWTRFNEQDKPILHNRVTYIVTRPGDTWGIQSRFSVGTWDGGDDSAEADPAADVAMQIVRDYLDALSTGGIDRCARLCRLPLVQVGIGKVIRMQDQDDIGRYLRSQASSFSNIDIKPAQKGPTGVNVAVSADRADGKRVDLFVLDRKSVV